jgi:hypothetical protein
VRNALWLPALAFALAPALASAADGDAELKFLLGVPGGQAPSTEFRACFDGHRAKLKANPNDLAPLVRDYSSGDAAKRSCAIAAEADLIAEHYKLSSPANGYGPMIRAMSQQAKVVSGKPAGVACPTRNLILDAAKQLDRILADFVPNYTYDWVGKSTNPNC